MNQLDLLSYSPPPRYPYAAGHRRVDTSVEAARKVDARCGRKQACYDEILEYLRARGAHGATTSEIGEALTGYDYSYLQPRTTEMYKLGFIFYDGERRPNAKGNSERVWRVL